MARGAPLQFGALFVPAGKLGLVDQPQVAFPDPRAAGWQPDLEPGPGPGGRTISGGNPSAAGPQGSGVATDKLVAQRYTEALVSNPTVIVGNATNRRGWQSFVVDRPMVLYRLEQIPIDIAGDIDGLFYYQPHRRPSDDSYALRSHGPGICYFSHPGIWWCKLAAGDGSASGAASRVCNVVLHDASDPGTAMRLLSEPGTNSSLQSHITFTDLANASNIVTRNPLRRAIIIQNLTVNVPIRVTFDRNLQIAGGIVAANAQLGLRLSGQGGSILMLSNDFLCKGHIQAILDFGAVGPAEVEAVEFY